MTERSLRDAMLLHVAQVARLDDDGVDGRSGLPEDLRERLSADETALAEWRGLVRQARALVSLGTHQASRLRAPADLDGRVVAALQAGRREERAVTALRSLARVDAPTELTARVRRLAERSFSDDPEHRAPRVLDRLVEEEIADHPASVTKRMVGGLTRHVAPSSLEDGLQAGFPQAGFPQAGFPQAGLSGPRREGSRLLDSRKARRLSRLMPAALVMALVGFGWNAYQGLDSGAIAAERWSFEIIEVDAASAPDLASLLDAFTGGGGSR